MTFPLSQEESRKISQQKKSRKIVRLRTMISACAHPLDNARPSGANGGPNGQQGSAYRRTRPYLPQDASSLCSRASQSLRQSTPQPAFSHLQGTTPKARAVSHFCLKAPRGERLLLRGMSVGNSLQYAGESVTTFILSLSPAFPSISPLQCVTDFSLFPPKNPTWNVIYSMTIGQIARLICGVQRG